MLMWRGSGAWRESACLRIAGKRFAMGAAEAAGPAHGGPLGLVVLTTVLILIGVLAFSIRLFSVSPFINFSA